MQILIYEDLNVGALGDKVDKIIDRLSKGDFRVLM